MLGPIVFLFLILLLGMACLHAAGDGWDGAGELVAICVCLVTILGAVVCQRFRSLTSLVVVSQVCVRGPPSAFDADFIGSPRPLRPDVVLPLRH